MVRHNRPVDFFSASTQQSQKTNENHFLGAADASDFSDDAKKLSKKSKSKKSKKSKDRERSRSMEPISPPPIKKRRSEKSEKTSPGSLSPVSEEENYTAAQSKLKKVNSSIKLLEPLHRELV